METHIWDEWRIKAVVAQRDELAEALRKAEAHDESIHAFSDLECFVDDPETHKEFWSEYCRRRDQRAILAKVPHD